MTDQPTLRNRIRQILAEADGFSYDCLEPHDYQRHADAILALPGVLSAPVDRAAVLREAADDLATAFGDPMAKHIGLLGAAHLRRRAREVEAGRPDLRRMADEARQPEASAEDPARIDRLRPEFTEHASVESIDVQLRRSRSQLRRWHLRVEWLISLRQARVEQKARGEWPEPEEAQR
ncbi:hypothetical protein [Streptomyces sp. NPDC056682]|uniref:hypothetical protein n=1 Tax=Streptomyces sp. NPDC056682 TaxID=3345909 RepID=UPI00367EBAA6